MFTVPWSLSDCTGLPNIFTLYEPIQVANPYHTYVHYTIGRGQRFVTFQLKKRGDLLCDHRGYSYWLVNHQLTWLPGPVRRYICLEF